MQVLELMSTYGMALARGVAVTLGYFAIGAIGALALALPVTLLLRSERRLPRLGATAYVEFFRNTPLLVQLFWLHYALPTLTGIKTAASVTAALGLVLVMTAYMAEVYRAGIGGVGRGQMEAAAALGLSRARSWQLVVLPQAFRVALPAIGSTLVAMLKATSILSILTVPELMRTTVRISDYTAKPLVFYSVSAVIYTLLCAALALSLGRLERKFLAKGRA